MGRGGAGRAHLAGGGGATRWCGGSVLLGIPECVVADAVAEQAVATPGRAGPAARAGVGAQAERGGWGEDLGPSRWVAHALGAVQGDQQCAGAAGYRVRRWLGAQAAQQLAAGAGATSEPALPPREGHDRRPEEAVLGQAFGDAG